MTIADINEQPRGCATDGKSHLNLTRSLADVWADDPPSRTVQIDRTPLPGAERPHFRTAARKPFAGYDQHERHSK